MAIFQRIANLFRVDRLSAELDEELAFHIAERTDDLVAEGMSEQEARREARKRFGHYVVQREETRDMNIYRWLEALVGDAKYGVRQLWLNPGFAAVAVLSLALGIGANSAIFQFINALRLRSIPVPNAEELALFDRGPDFSTSGWYSSRHPAFTFPQYLQVREQQQAFSDVLAFGTTEFNLSLGGESRYAEGLWISPNFVELLGVAPMLGNWLPADSDPRDCASAGALLDYKFFEREYSADPEIIGKNINLDGRAFPIVAVMPPHYRGLEPDRRFDVALPICADGLFASDGVGRLQRRDAWWLTFVGRLKPDWTAERASAHVRDISPAIFETTVPERFRPDAAEEYRENSFIVREAHAGVSDVREDADGPLWILLAATGFVLLIACANLANLLLARASAREREVALRQAVGASRWRLVSQLMVEALILATLGAALGSWFAQMLSQGLLLFIAQNTPNTDLALGMDWNVFAFTTGLAMLTCLLFGLAPAIRATRGAPADAMRGGRGSTSTAERYGLRRALVVAQISLSFVLLVGALLFGQSLRNLLAAETGMDSEGVLIATIDARLPNLEPERRLRMFDEMEARINAIPDVISASGIVFRPFSGSGWNESVHADDDPSTTGGEHSWFNRTTPGYFQTVKAPLLAGRDIAPGDDKSAPAVAVVNEAFAERFFGGEDPVGRTFRSEARLGEEDPVYQVIGLVKNTKYYELREDPLPQAFLPLAQDERPNQQLSFVVRARGSFDSVMNGIKDEMSRVESGLLVEYQVMAIEEVESVMVERIMANLSGGFGLLAALLSMLGLYGVMAYMVARRRNEIGVRMALGAERSDIRGLVFTEAGRLVAMGLGIGLVGSFAVSRYAESLLFGLEPNDLATLAMGGGLLAVTAVVAAFVPLRRATRLDPAVVLRDE